MMLERRSFLKGLFCAPAIIKLAPLMRISTLPSEPTMRMLMKYHLDGDFVTRLDVLYSNLYVRPEWAVVVADVV